MFCCHCSIIYNVTLHPISLVSIHYKLRKNRWGKISQICTNREDLLRCVCGRSRYWELARSARSRTNSTSNSTTSEQLNSVPLHCTWMERIITLPVSCAYMCVQTKKQKWLCAPRCVQRVTWPDVNEADAIIKEVKPCRITGNKVCNQAITEKCDMSTTCLL